MMSNPFEQFNVRFRLRPVAPDNVSLTGQVQRPSTAVQNLALGTTPTTQTNTGQTLTNGIETVAYLYSLMQNEHGAQLHLRPSPLCDLYQNRSVAAAQFSASPFTQQQTRMVHQTGICPAPQSTVALGGIFHQADLHTATPLPDYMSLASSRLSMLASDLNTSLPLTNVTLDRPAYVPQVLEIKPQDDYLSTADVTNDIVPESQQTAWQQQDFDMNNSYVTIQQTGLATHRQACQQPILQNFTASGQQLVWPRLTLSAMGQAQRVVVVGDVVKRGMPAIVNNPVAYMDDSESTESGSSGDGVTQSTKEEPVTEFQNQTTVPVSKSFQKRKAIRKSKYSKGWKRMKRCKLKTTSSSQVVTKENTKEVPDYEIQLNESQSDDESVASASSQTPDGNDLNESHSGPAGQGIAATANDTTQVSNHHTKNVKSNSTKEGDVSHCEDVESTGGSSVVNMVKENVTEKTDANGSERSSRCKIVRVAAAEMPMLFDMECEDDKGDDSAQGTVQVLEPSRHDKQANRQNSKQHISTTKTLNKRDSFSLGVDHTQQRSKTKSHRDTRSCDKKLASKAVVEISNIIEIDEDCSKDGTSDQDEVIIIDHQPSKPSQTTPSKHNSDAIETKSRKTDQGQHALRAEPSKKLPTMSEFLKVALKDNINSRLNISLQMLYLRLIENSPTLDKLVGWLKSDEEKMLNGSNMESRVRTAQKTAERPVLVFQCSYCPYVEPSARRIGLHIKLRHNNIMSVYSKTNNSSNNRKGIVPYLHCRHCDFVSYDSTIMWIHFATFHQAFSFGPHLTDELPRSPISGKILEFDGLATEFPFYSCFDCKLLFSDRGLAIDHIIKNHSELPFPGCFVRLQMICRTSKCTDKVTYGMLSEDENYVGTRKEIFVCICCSYFSFYPMFVLTHFLTCHTSSCMLYICAAGTCTERFVNCEEALVHVQCRHLPRDKSSQVQFSVTMIDTVNNVLSECHFVPGELTSADVPTDVTFRPIQTTVPSAVIELDDDEDDDDDVVVIDSVPAAESRTALTATSVAKNDSSHMVTSNRTVSLTEEPSKTVHEEGPPVELDPVICEKETSFDVPITCVNSSLEHEKKALNMSVCMESSSIDKNTSVSQNSLPGVVVFASSELSFADCDTTDSHNRHSHDAMKGCHNPANLPHTETEAEMSSVQLDVGHVSPADTVSHSDGNISTCTSNNFQAVFLAALTNEAQQEDIDEHEMSDDDDDDDDGIADADKLAMNEPSGDDGAADADKLTANEPSGDNVVADADKLAMNEPSGDDGAADADKLAMNEPSGEDGAADADKLTTNEPSGDDGIADADKLAMNEPSGDDAAAGADKLTANEPTGDIVVADADKLAMNEPSGDDGVADADKLTMNEPSGDDGAADPDKLTTNEPSGDDGAADADILTTNEPSGDDGVADADKLTMNEPSGDDGAADTDKLTTNEPSGDDGVADADKLTMNEPSGDEAIANADKLTMNEPSGDDGAADADKLRTNDPSGHNSIANADNLTTNEPSGDTINLLTGDSHRDDDINVTSAYLEGDCESIDTNDNIPEVEFDEEEYTLCESDMHETSSEPPTDSQTSCQSEGLPTQNINVERFRNLANFRFSASVSYRLLPDKPS